jgi:hypothetical protein
MQPFAIAVGYMAEDLKMLTPAGEAKVVVMHRPAGFDQGWNKLHELLTTTFTHVIPAGVDIVGQHGGANTVHMLICSDVPSSAAKRASASTKYGLGDLRIDGKEILYFKFNGKSGELAKKDGEGGGEGNGDEGSEGGAPSKTSSPVPLFYNDYGKTVVKGMVQLASGVMTSVGASPIYDVSDPRPAGQPGKNALLLAPAGVTHHENHGFLDLGFKYQAGLFTSYLYKLSVHEYGLYACINRYIYIYDMR